MRQSWLRSTAAFALLSIMCFVSFSIYGYEQLQDIQKAGIRLQNLVSDNIEDKSDSSYDNDMIPIYLVLREQYDTDYLYQVVRDMPKPERREHTVKTLKSFSEETQQDLRVLVEKLHSEDLVDKIRYLWITNIIGMEATPEAILQFESHPDVGLIEYDPLQYVLIDEPSDEINYSEGNFEKNFTANSPRRSRDDRSGRLAPHYRNPADNVAHHNAPDVWEQGFMGQGVVVSVIDTGVNYNHHDIRNQMWEHPDFPFHGYNTFANTNQPMDDHRHGSHCAGTVAGSGESGTITGLAPRATIMALKCLSNTGNGQEQMYWAAVEFSVLHGADVLSVSLGWRYSGNPNRAEFRRVMANTLNAGVVASIAAGNEGNSGLRTPGDTPPPWLHPDQQHIGGLSATVTVGATDLGNQIANFSSRGPVSWHTIDPYNDYPHNPGSGLLKPDICAVGVNVLSLVHNNNTGYTQMSGTSMAAPAVAGIIALMLSKNPNLTPEDVSEILETTAIPLSVSKSNTFGAGLANAVDAVDAAAFIAIHEVTYSGGENNIPEYGETLGINISLINLGIEGAEEVVGVLSTDDDYIEIINDIAEYGEIEIDSVVTVNDAYTVRIADNIPDGYEVTFTLSVSIDEETSWDFPFTMKVSAPYLVTLIPYISDEEPGGNNNSYIDPGENVILYLPISNTGGSNSPDIVFNVNSESDLVEITGISRTDFDQLSSGNTVYPALHLSVSEEAEYEDLIRFDYSLEAGNYLFEGHFNAIVGGVIPAILGSGDLVTEPNVTSPINTYFKSNRTQTVYTAEQLNEAGVQGQLPLTRMGYYVEVTSEHPLPDFEIRMKHTTAADASEHDDGPFLSVYTAERYEPTSGRWDMLTFQTPFIWNGRDNILVDTAFAPVREWSASGQLRVNQVDNGFRYVRADNPDQRNVPTVTVSEHKPQVFMLFDTVIGDEYARPVNLTAELVGLEVQLNWEAPQQRRGNEASSGRSRRGSNLPRSGGYDDNYRNPDGYLIYRNGIRLNDEPHDDLEYTDIDYSPSATYYYYVKAVYGDNVSPPSNIVDLQIRTTQPIFTPSDGIQYESFRVTINSSTPDAVIYYTLDGSEPDTEAILYEAPFDIDRDTTVKAIAYREDWPESYVSAIDYYVLYSPTSLTAVGKVNSVYLEWEAPEFEERNRFETIDNDSFGRSNQSRTRRQSALHRNDYVYRNHIGYNVYRFVSPDSFIVINDQLIETEEYLDDNIPATGQLSYHVTAVYDAGESLPTQTINVRSIVAKPVFSPEPGEYEEPFDLTMNVSTTGAVIYYTLDDNDPDEASLVFDTEVPITIETTTTVKAIAFLGGWQESEISVGYFEFPTNIDEEQILPVYATELLNAYPNPFNPETVIEFTLKENDHVRIEIFDVSGRRVRVLADENFETGRHKLIWQGDNNRAEKLSSGIYFYRMTTSEYDQVKKILMLK